MPAAPVLRIETSNIANDCAVLALARYLGLPYLHVLQQAALVVGTPLSEGLTVKEMKRVAEALGTPLVRKQRVDPDETYGIVILYDHALVLRNGLAFDANGTVWDWEDWLAHYRQGKKAWQARQVSVLVERG